MQWNVRYTWKKVSVSHYWNCTHRPLTKNDPHVGDFIDTHCLKEQVKSIKDWVSTERTGARWGPRIWHGRVPLDKHTLGNTVRITRDRAKP